MTRASCSRMNAGRISSSTACVRSAVKRSRCAGDQPGRSATSASGASSGQSDVSPSSRSSRMATVRSPGARQATRPSSRLRAQAVEVAVRVDGHLAPPGDHAPAVLDGLEPLVVGDQEEVRRDALDRVDVPVEQPRVELGDVGRDGLAQHQQADLRLALEQPRIELVHPVEQARRTARGSRPSPRAWGRGGGRRSAGRRSRSRTAGASRGTSPSTRRRARRDRRSRRGPSGPP